MAVNPKTDLTVTRYRQQTPPSSNDVLPLYVYRELQRIATALETLADAAPQALDVAPKTPRKGMVRYAIGAWATSLGGEGLYVYKDLGWAKIV